MELPLAFLVRRFDGAIKMRLGAWVDNGAKNGKV